MPNQHLLELLTTLLLTENGKEKFKTICSINHGNKYKIAHGIIAYDELFEKSLFELK